MGRERVRAGAGTRTERQGEDRAQRPESWKEAGGERRRRQRKKKAEVESHQSSVPYHVEGAGSEAEKTGSRKTRANKDLSSLLASCLSWLLAFLVLSQTPKCLGVLIKRYL